MENHHCFIAELPSSNGFTELNYDNKNGYLKSLRPARMFSFRDADGIMVQTVLKTCRKCNNVKDGVRDECCELKMCGTASSVCRDCTKKRTCFTCGVQACKCCFFKCCVGGCQNYMCHNFVRALHGSSSVCSSALSPGHIWVPTTTDAGELGKCCQVHKPAGAVKFD
jgi:hypothetical protein